MALLDELESGLAPLSTPEIQHALDVGPGVASALSVGAVGVIASVVEPWLLWRLRDGLPRRMVTIGLCVSAALCTAAAWLPWPVVALAAVVAMGTASGVVTAFAQTALAQMHARNEEATARWGVAGAVGDLLAPALLVAVHAVGADFRQSYACMAVLNLTLALLLMRAAANIATPSDNDQEDEPALSWRHALENRALLIAAAGVAATTLLDEIVLSVGALWLAPRVASPWDKAVLEALVAGTLLGAFTCQAVVRRLGTVRVLLLSVAISLPLHAGLFGVSGAPALAGVMFFYGVVIAWQHPLVMALAFDAAGNRPQLATAACAWFLPLETAAPFAVAWVTEALGVSAGLVLLAIQPAVVGAVALWFARAGRSLQTPP